MKAGKWWQEIPLLGIMLCPALVYYWLKPLLPALIPSHYTISANGEWVVDGQMSPAMDITVTLVVSLFIYLILTLAVLLPYRNQLPQAWLKPMLYWLKAGMLLLISAIPVYQMLVSAGKLTGGAATVWAYIGGIGMVVLLNIFIYRMYDLMYKRSESKPLGRTSYVIIWAGTHVVVSIGPFCLLLAQHLNADRMIVQMILLFITICGNLLYSVRPNPYLGIRTPWTLKNDTVWRETHRLGGVMMFIMGATGFIATFFADRQQVHFVLVTSLLTATFIPMVYSYIRYRKLTHQP
ncbi:MAG: SdpI family protein [Chitinophaga sp.]|uniref:SdpI family protein n=1 Tax=Chitinophaga sp. TaxID=1869181 RepID=UPI001B0A0602|nr:SdpI family protein [Chitinophaga sp.]MBO9730886.1 SdpI family protein [Chitinophaga sp.]